MNCVRDSSPFLVLTVSLLFCYLKTYHHPYGSVLEVHDLDGDFFVIAVAVFGFDKLRESASTIGW